MRSSRRWRASAWPWDWQGAWARSIGRGNLTAWSGRSQTSPHSPASCSPSRGSMRRRSPPNSRRSIFACSSSGSYLTPSTKSPTRTADVIVLGAAEPIAILGNADLLRRAIENVVRNAIFYTSDNTEVRIVLARTSPQIISVEVRDCGPGVPNTALEHLFEPFYRVDEARARDTGGTGIGLAICQRIVHLHGGSVQARRNTPTGLIVVMEFPSSSAGLDATVRSSMRLERRDAADARHAVINRKQPHHANAIARRPMPRASVQKTFELCISSTTCSTERT